MQQEEWNAKYRDAPESAVGEPSPIVTELLPLIPRGVTLDIACGAGRHTLLLAEHGYSVAGVDASSAALDIVERNALRTGLEVRRSAELGPSYRGKAHSLQLIQADLESASLPANSFDLILCVHYLQRSLFPQIHQALRPGGMLLFETFTRAQLQFSGGPRNTEFLLENYELRGAFPQLRTIFYRELHAGKGIASLLAQKPA